ncbi:MAG: peptidylprolyl isomerase [Patescibacteria group bacterium]
MKKTLLFLVPAILIVAGAVYLFANKKITTTQPVTETEDTQTNVTNEMPVPGTTTTETVVINEAIDLSKYNTPIMIIDKNKTYTAKMKTSAGEIEIALNAGMTPVTVNNFVFLAKKNFYDNVIFHRAIKDFMIQGGDPEGNGAGGPGYKFDDEPFTGEYLRGTLAMANAGPNTNGSQFFIMHADYPLPPNYVIFGKVTKGLDVVDKIANAPVTMNNSGENSQPVTPVKILSVKISEE